MEHALEHQSETHVREKEDIMAGKFEIKKTKDGQFFFHLKASNGQIILVSERYKARSGAQNGIKSVKANAADDGRYQRLTSSNGKAYFVLKAGNRQIIGTSEMYSSESARDNGIASVRTSAPDAGIDDLT